MIRVVEAIVIVESKLPVRNTFPFRSTVKSLVYLDPLPLAAFTHCQFKFCDNELKMEHAEIKKRNTFSFMPDLFRINTPTYNDELIRMYEIAVITISAPQRPCLYSKIKTNFKQQIYKDR